MEIGNAKCSCQSPSRGSLEALLSGGLQAEYVYHRNRLIKRLTLTGLLFLLLLQAGRALHTIFAQIPDGALYELLLTIAIALPIIIFLYKNTYSSAKPQENPEPSFNPELILGIFLSSFWKAYNKK